MKVNGDTTSILKHKVLRLTKYLDQDYKLIKLETKKPSGTLNIMCICAKVSEHQSSLFIFTHTHTHHMHLHVPIYLT